MDNPLCSRTSVPFLQLHFVGQSSGLIGIHVTDGPDHGTFRHSYVTDCSLLCGNFCNCARRQQIAVYVCFVFGKGIDDLYIQCAILTRRHGNGICQVVTVIFFGKHRCGLCNVYLTGSRNNVFLEHDSNHDITNDQLRLSIVWYL